MHTISQSDVLWHSAVREIDMCLVKFGLVLSVEEVRIQRKFVQCFVSSRPRIPLGLTVQGFGPLFRRLDMEEDRILEAQAAALT